MIIDYFRQPCFARFYSIWFYWAGLLLMSFHVVVSATENSEENYRVNIDETEEAFFSEIPNVISATRIRQPLTKAPASVTIIDRAMIEASGAIELADVFRLVPGVQVSYPQGNQTAVIYHGFSDGFPRKMQVLVDGRSVYQPSFADVDWTMLGVVLEDVERVEVVRGANSPLYGANSVQGVINIVTRQSYQDGGTFIGATGGSLKTRNGVIRHIDKMGKLDYRLTASYEAADGFRGDSNSTNDGRDVLGVSFRGMLQHSVNDEIDIQIGVKGGRLGAGDEFTLGTAPAHNKDVISNYQFINWRHSYNNGGDSQLQFYRNAYQSKDKYRDLLSNIFTASPAVIPLLIGGRPDQSIELGAYDYKGDRYNLEWQYNSPRMGKWRSVLGIGGRVNRYKSLALTNENKWITESSGRIFANTEYHASNSIIANFGVMIEDSDHFGTYASPRIALNYLFTPQHSLRVSYSQTQRNPSLFENNFKRLLKLDDGTAVAEIGRSLDVEAETVTSAEIGFIGFWLDKRLFLDVKLFKEKTEDVIHARIDPSLSQPFNAAPVPIVDNDGTFKSEGIEAQLKYKLAPKDFISFQYANLHANSTLTAQVGSTALWPDAELSVPKHTASTLLSHRFSPNYEASIAYYYLSKMFWLSNGDEVDAYHRWDFRVAGNWRIRQNRLQLEFIAQNLGGDYQSFRNENVFETRYFLRLGIEL